jgi:hypothetical protein
MQDLINETNDRHSKPHAELGGDSRCFSFHQTQASVPGRILTTKKCDTHAKLKSATVGHEHTCCLDKLADIIVISGEPLHLDEFSKLWTKPSGKTTMQPLRRGVN